MGILHLPNGHTVTVSPVYGGLYFKTNDLVTHQTAFPAGWTIVLHSEETTDSRKEANGEPDETDTETSKKHIHVHRYRTPTRQNDALFISSISNPSSSDFKPAVSPTRQIAMMLWATLCWYFHQPLPKPQLTDATSAKIPEAGRPQGEWRIHIKREGIFKGRHLLPKLERMGLIASHDSCVGIDPDDQTDEGWNQMFVSQRLFWQLDPRIFLFSLSPTGHSPYPFASPYPSRPSSPSRESIKSPRPESGKSSRPESFRMEPSRPESYYHDPTNPGLWSPTAPGPFTSASHIPTYYPPPPTQYTMTNNIRHPIRQKPPRQGETFYTRYIPSCNSYLSFRVASLSRKCVTHAGPMSSPQPPAWIPPHSALSPSIQQSMSSMTLGPCDIDLLHKWMNDDRVAAAWGASGPIEVQERLLKTALTSTHSFPVIGCWDGKPFGYCEIYWAKEDQVGRYCDAGDWDRGCHVLSGEAEFRGPERVKVWLSALVHYCWLADQRTERVLAEPRVDNEKIIKYFEGAGFHKEKEIAFPFKQAALMRISREAWDSPAI